MHIEIKECYIFPAVIDYLGSGKHDCYVSVYVLASEQRTGKQKELA